jgi:hypothetical protein
LAQESPHDLPGSAKIELKNISNVKRGGCNEKNEYSSMLGSYHIFESTIGTNFHMKKRISLIISFFFKILYLDQYLDYHQNANRHFSSRLILTQTRFSPKILSKVD